jgi:hypothetical protein
MTRTFVLYSLLALAALALAGCASTGFGQGTLEPVSARGYRYAQGPAQVAFAWRSDGLGNDHGRISATFPDGRRFEGTYVEPTSTSDNWILGGGPVCGWRGCWDDGGWAGTTTHYSGVLLAQMVDASREQLNCRFTLAEPREGPSGGGIGQCTLSTGERIDGVALQGE